MTNQQDMTGSSAVRPIAPPPLSQHLRELGAVIGDPSRLYEYDPDTPGSSRRRE
jgi:hypothetical protein